MTAKLPPDAFTFYVGLGSDRSYQAVADRYGVDKKTVTRRASTEDWQGRIARIETEARDRSDEKAIESLDQMNARHLKTLRVIQAKALETLKAHPLTTAMEAVRALDLSIKHERVIRGEPSERTAVSVENTIKREYERWLSVEEETETAGVATEDPAEWESTSEEPTDADL